MKYSSVYNCPITKYTIEYIVDTDSNDAMLNTIVCDYMHLKAFMSLIRTSVDKLLEKNIKTISQSVAVEEWNLYLKNKTTWRIKKYDENNDIYDIECYIDDFLSNYGIGIGILN